MATMQRHDSPSSSEASSPDYKTTHGKVRNGGERKPRTRKKVAKACLACQKSHLTCDEQRPCTRCMRKGIGDQCVEGVRKKAKYLLEGEERHPVAKPPPPPAPPKSTSPLTNTTSGQTNPFPLPPMSIGSDRSFDGRPSSSNTTPHQTLSGNPNQSFDQPYDQSQSFDQNNNNNNNNNSFDQNNSFNPGLTSTTTRPSLNPSQSFGSDRPYDAPNTSSTGQHVPDDVWLAGPLNDNDGADAGQKLWDDPFSGTDRIDDADVPSSSMYPFGVTAAADEFQMLDAMFGGLSPSLATFPDPFSNNGMQQSESPSLLLDTNALGQQQQQQSQQQPDAMQQPWDNKPFDMSFNIQSQSQNQNQNQNQNPTQTAQSQPSRPQPTPVKDTRTLSAALVNSTLAAEQASRNRGMGMNVGSAQGLWSQSLKDGNGALRSEVVEGGGPFLEPLTKTSRGPTASEVYRKILKPYDYTEGYHVLMDYLTKNFEREDILSVVHALASFRPSLIALQMPMSEEDEVFIERSFQRTMIELEKLISYSATPTAVWRRTGEICYANPEFCSLAGKSDAELYGKKSYIYHLFEKPSVITYWENFSVHAFENTTQNFFQPATLSVNGSPVACSCCFTIRRDVFDLPSVVIGQFLRIPSDI